VYLHDDLCTFIIVFRRIPLRVRNVSDRLVEKSKSNISCSVIFSPESRALCEMVWKNVVGSDRPQMEIRV
jgi:hypothetical protein